MHEINGIGDTIVEEDGPSSVCDRAPIDSDTISGGFVSPGSNVEAATILVATRLALQGTASDNWLIGNAEANLLLGISCNDRLDGRGGDDSSRILNQSVADFDPAGTEFQFIT